MTEGMNTTVENYQLFFSDQVMEQEIGQKTLIKTPINQLLRKEEICVGYVDHINTQTGHVVFKFPRNRAPRLKVQKSLMVIKKGAFCALGRRVYDWQISLYDFCANLSYHSNYSDALPLYYTKGNDSSYDYVGCTSISIQLFDLFEKCLKEAKSLTVIFFSPFPPTEYFENLNHFMDLCPDNKELLLEPLCKYEEWHPEELSFDDNRPNAIPEKIIETLDERKCCILQGPPGSGKSYTIASIIAKYLNEGKTVCATTMANKGLVELAQQPPLKPFLEENKISKTSLSADERRLVKGLKPVHKGLNIPAGELLLSTNYILSHVFKPRNMQENGLPLYDLVVIEEASQAFLTTIVAFKSLGKNCLIVGDPMQLPPIIINPRKSIYKAWHVNTQVNGLITYALGSGTKAYRIITTFRLTPKSAKLTSIFYDNRFTSVKKDLLDFSKISSPYFPSEGGDLYVYTDDLKNQILSDSALCIIKNVVSLFEKNYPKRSFAIISPFNDSVKQLQKNFLTDTRIGDFTIETIDRIQGMTVDYTILYIPGRNPGFALDERRFNVATSRSRSTTLIIADVPLQNFHTVPAKVITFLKNSIMPNDSFSEAYRCNKNADYSQADLKLLYPGLENIVDQLIKANIPFDRDGNIDLTDKDGEVVASAAMLFVDKKVAIDPLDKESEMEFKKRGYRLIDSSNFDITMLEE